MGLKMDVEAKRKRETEPAKRTQGLRSEANTDGIVLNSFTGIVLTCSLIALLVFHSNIYKYENNGGHSVFIAIRIFFVCV